MDVRVVEKALQKLSLSGKVGRGSRSGVDSETLRHAFTWAKDGDTIGSTYARVSRQAVLERRMQMREAQRRAKALGKKLVCPLCHRVILEPLAVENGTPELIFQNCEDCSKDFSGNTISPCTQTEAQVTCTDFDAGFGTVENWK